MPTTATISPLAIVPSHPELVEGTDKQLLSPEEQKLVSIIATIVVDQTFKQAYDYVPKPSTMGTDE